MMRVKAMLTVLLMVTILAAAVWVLPGCNALADKDRAAAARLEAEVELARAEAARERAAAEAEADRVKAQAEAEVQRQRAAAEKAQAEADAYQKRLQADTSAAAERSALRQAERDAAHERTLELLPFVLLIVGVVAVGGLAVALVANNLRRHEAPDPILMFLLQRQDRRLQELERVAYHQIAMEQRKQLSSGGGEIIVYRPEERDQNGRR